MLWTNWVDTAPAMDTVCTMCAMLQTKLCFIEFFYVIFFKAMDELMDMVMEKKVMSYFFFRIWSWRMLLMVRVAVMDAMQVVMDMLLKEVRKDVLEDRFVVMVDEGMYMAMDPIMDGILNGGYGVMVMDCVVLCFCV